VKQLRGLRGFREEVEKRGAAVVAVVGDRPEAIKAFKEREGIWFDVLQDPDGAAFRSFGVARAGQVKGRPYAHPTTILLDREGIARHVEVRKWTFFSRGSPGELVKALDGLA
jgi:peroxiredoxin